MACGRTVQPATQAVHGTHQRGQCPLFHAHTLVCRTLSVSVTGHAGSMTAAAAALWRARATQTQSCACGQVHSHRERMNNCGLTVGMSVCISSLCSCPGTPMGTYVPIHHTLLHWVQCTGAPACQYAVPHAGAMPSSCICMLVHCYCSTATCADVHGAGTWSGRLVHCRLSC